MILPPLTGLQARALLFPRHTIMAVNSPAAHEKRSRPFHTMRQRAPQWFARRGPVQNHRHKPCWHRDEFSDSPPTRTLEPVRALYSWHSRQIHVARETGRDDRPPTEFDRRRVQRFAPTLEQTSQIGAESGRYTLPVD